MSESSGLRAPGRLPELERYPQRDLCRENAVDRWGASLVGTVISRGNRLRLRRLSRIVAAVNQHTDTMAALHDDVLHLQAKALRRSLRREPVPEFSTVAHSFAVIREVAHRTLGLRHFDVQLVGGYALLQGMVAEMETGEGKTLTATLAAATAALAGRHVHVVTVNDYLVQRDADWMGPLFGFLDLTVGAIVAGLSPEEKRQAYASDIVYCTNKVVAFDYMRDSLRLGRRRSNLQLQAERLYGERGRTRSLLLRGLDFAIVDEADSVLVDEARTPLVISGEVDPPIGHATLEQALDTAKGLDRKADFRVNVDRRMVELTSVGKDRLRTMAQALGDPWGIRALREEVMIQALAALHVFHRDDDYLVEDEKVLIVDEYTGRVMPDRQWSQGLHQLIELKEGCKITGQRITLARMTYQRFFRRYKHLCGMTGTAREVGHELWCVYRLRVAGIPTNRPIRRQRERTLVVPTQAEKWAVIARRADELSRMGRPVLLGTRSVAASAAASAALDKLGLQHQVLSAAQDEREAEIIADAGTLGRITIATNMAGRGTDIRLGDGVAARGGLHVIMSERHEAGRIDRQLAGRSARQGDPGSHQAILSLEDPLLAPDRLSGLRQLAVLWMPGGGLGAWALRRAQRRAERRHSRVRRDLMKLDDMIGDSLAFSGEQE